MKIENQFSRDDINFLTKKNNQETAKFREAFPFTFVVRGNSNQKNKSTIATFVTMILQGLKAFYEQLEYLVYFQREGYIQNSSCLFLRLNL